MDNIKSNYIGTASFTIAIYSLDVVEYTDRETKEIKKLNRAITDQGIVYVPDDVASKLRSADLLHPVSLTARIGFKDGRPQYYFKL